MPAVFSRPDRVALSRRLIVAENSVCKETMMDLSNALPILRALADGVNPVTGEAYPEHSPYAEPRTLRALYSAVDIVRREVEREKRRERLPANFGKPWTDGEDEQLRQRYQSGVTLHEIARTHARTQSSVRLRLEKLGLISPQTA